LPMATYAIGDVQGCFNGLQRLLDRISFDSTTDRLLFVGDLVNRGPESLAVLRLVKGLGSRATTVLGNHELHLLAVSEGVREHRQRDTFGDVIKAPDRDEILAWLRQRPLLHVEGSFVLVHAGLLPQWTVSQAVAVAGEVEGALQADDYPGLLRSLYQPSPPLRWSDGLAPPARLTVATMALTRLRTLTEDGAIDLTYSGPLEALPPGLQPWFDRPDRLHRNATVICGHWAALGLRLRPDLLAIDGGCVYGRRLIAARLEDRSIFEVPCGC
jgi:bis(5'-nucleosyl)-tetraphosphatase (symmetrical)